MALNVGDPAPDFNMPTADGGNVSLSNLRGKKVVLYFYPKDDTPGCTVEACAFRDNFPNFQNVNAEIIGVSRDDTASHQRFRDKFGLNFTLASDTTGEVTENYGVWTEKSMYGKTFMGIQRATFLIDEDGKVAHIWPKVSVDGHADEVMAAIKGEAPNSAKATRKKAASKKSPKAAATKAAAKKKAPAKAAGKKTAKKSAKKTSKKAARKTAKASARKAGRKTAKRSAKASVKASRTKASAKKKSARKTSARKASATKASARKTVARKTSVRKVARRRTGRR